MLAEKDLREALHKKALQRRDILLSILAVNEKVAKSVDEVRRLGRLAGMPEIEKWNVSDILGRAKGLTIRVPDGWILTSGGRTQVQALGILSEAKDVHLVRTADSLRKAAVGIVEKNSQSFVIEAITCFEANLFRACVVLSWAGAVSLLYSYVLKNCLAQFNAEVLKRDSKWRSAKTADDLGRMKESDFLDIIGAPPLSIISKNLKEELKNNCLQLRNACGHPSSLVVSENRVAAHVEVLILNVFTKFA